MSKDLVIISFYDKHDTKINYYYQQGKPTEILIGDDVARIKFRWFKEVLPDIEEVFKVD